MEKLFLQFHCPQSPMARADLTLLRHLRFQHFSCLISKMRTNYPNASQKTSNVKYHGFVKMHLRWHIYVHICKCAYMCIYAPQITSRMSQISKNTRLGEDQYILKRSLRPTLFMSPLPDELICVVS